jgi:hypothetical protein
MLIYSFQFSGFGIWTGSGRKTSNFCVFRNDPTVEGFIVPIYPESWHCTAIRRNGTDHKMIPGFAEYFIIVAFPGKKDQVINFREFW